MTTQTNQMTVDALRAKIEALEWHIESLEREMWYLKPDARVGRELIAALNNTHDIVRR